MGEKNINMNRVCRTCLREDGDMKSLFTIRDELKQHEPRLCQMLMSSTRLQINENDTLPCQICANCADQLFNAYTFKHMCEQSDATLKKNHLYKNKLSNCEPPLDSDGVKKEIQCTAGNGIIDFNSMFVGDMPSVKLEDSDNIIYDLDEKKDICYSAFDLDKFTQISFNNVLSVHNCPQCQKKFLSDKGLMSHMKKHMMLSANSCSECNKIFINDESVNAHKMEVHGNLTVVDKATIPILFECQECKKSFDKEEDLKQHYISHEKVKHDCDRCGAKFNRNAALVNHKSSCKSKLYKCIICKSNFQTNKELSRHNKECNSVKEESSEIINNSDMPKTTTPMNGTISNVNTIFSEDDAIKSSLNIKEEPLDELLDEAERAIDILDDNMFDEYHEPDIGKCENIGSDDCEDYEPETNTKLMQYKHGGKKKKNKVGKIKVTYPCNLCPKVLSTATRHKIHMNEHSEKPIINCHPCDECDKTFPRLYLLKRHMLTHSADYPCGTCKKVFHRKDHLNKHMWQHVDKKPFPCDICPKGFIKMQHLERHKFALHSGKEKNPKTAFCGICNRGFTTEKYLETHMRMHTGDKTHTCKVCNKSFNSKWHLKEHVKWHSAEKPFLCSECGQRFIRNDYLVIHMRRHKGEKPYKCKYCNKGFPRATDLTVHERYHTGEKTHLCTVCGKGFQRQYNLTVHLRVHTGEKPYNCSYCGKKFAQGNDLKGHVRRHTGERFNCEVCGEGFIQGYHLTQHKRCVHGIDCSSHIRRVEKHTKVEQQNNPNHKYRTRVVNITEEQSQVKEDSGLEITLVPLENGNNAINSDSKGSDNDSTDLTKQLSLQSHLAAAVVERVSSLVPLVPLAFFPTVTSRHQ